MEKLRQKKEKPIGDILDIAGTLVPKKNKGRSALEAREYMEKHYRRV